MSALGSHLISLLAAAAGGKKTIVLTGRWIIPTSSRPRRRVQRLFLRATLERSVYRPAAADDFDRAMGARRDSQRHAADQESFETSHASRADEDAVGHQIFSLTAQQRFRLLLFHHYRHLQSRLPEFFRRAIYHLPHPLGFLRDPLGEINSRSRIARWRECPCRIDDPDRDRKS